MHKHKHDSEWLGRITVAISYDGEGKGLWW